MLMMMIMMMMVKALDVQVLGFPTSFKEYF